MMSEAGERIRISLEGDWSMSGITGQFQVLLQWVSRLTEAGGKAVTPELDLNGITELDASGCQLLTAFFGKLRQQGIVPLCNEVAEAVCSKLHQLGFDQEAALGQCFSREQL